MELLTFGEYNRLARLLRERGVEPADLLGPNATDLFEAAKATIATDRLKQLLDRGFLLSQAIEQWSARGIWVVSRADADYPKRLKARLKEDASPILYGCGEPQLLEKGGLAVVGSRHVDVYLLEYARGIGALAAEAECSLISGGARGIDVAAMQGAAMANGKVIGVLADDLGRAVLAREHREALMDKKLVLISPYDPAAGFNVGNAMQRNKVIYALSDAALVVSSDFEKGGTWTGAVEQLEQHRFVPVFVRSGPEAGKGIEALRKKGALVWPEPRDRASLEAALIVRLPANSNQPKLSESNIHDRDSVSSVTPETANVACNDTGNRSHLFISYAVEDNLLAKWLARKLAACGYAVWFDQMKLLGGEPWPQTIDEAIKNRTFRMLALISAHSLRKRKPTGERELAQRLGEKLGVADFLIPLKADGSELDWLTTTVSYIPFNQGWAEGWRALTKKLNSISAPRLLTNATRVAASSLPRGDDLLTDQGESLFTNIVRVKSFPPILRVFRVSQSLKSDEWRILEKTWAFYEIAADTLVALVSPPHEFADRIKPTPEQLLWAECELFRNVRARDIAVSLIMKVLARRLTRGGFHVHPNPKFTSTFYLPEDYTENGKITFNGFKGKKTWLQIRGRVAFRRGSAREVNFHNFAFRLRLARGLDQGFYVQLTPSLVFFDEMGNPILDKSVGPRRRRLTKMWWNNKWLNRVLAAEQMLTGLPAAGPDDLTLEPCLVTLKSPIGLNESFLQFDSDEDELPADEIDTELLLDDDVAMQADE
jgi:predicted Rossmann fold nucleotide-binding protein DprA/Smf involved in DNA uptake